MLPNFMVLGAQKAGTTTLARFFELHPSIYIPAQRETRFFIHPHLYSKGIIHYEAQFFGNWAGETAVGEKTPEYLVDEEVPDRLARMMPCRPRFIVCLRSPAARAYAGYRQNLAMARESESFARALELEPERTAKGQAYLATYGYAARSRYARQIGNWLAAFPDFLERTLFIDFDELTGRQRQVFADVAQFLDVETLPVQEAIREGGTSELGSPLSIDGGEVLWRKKPIMKPSAELVAFALKNRSAREAAEPLPADSAAEMNRRIFGEDIRQLENLLSRSFAHWLD